MNLGFEIRKRGISDIIVYFLLSKVNIHVCEKEYSGLSIRPSVKFAQKYLKFVCFSIKMWFLESKACHVMLSSVLLLESMSCVDFYDGEMKSGEGL